MSNQEEQQSANENKEQNNPSNNQSQEVGNESTSSGGSHMADPEHNTGNDRMRIDEEGAEIKPDDEV